MITIAQARFKVAVCDATPDWEGVVPYPLPDGRYLLFKDAHDAVLFKLMWYGEDEATQ